MSKTISTWLWVLSAMLLICGIATFGALALTQSGGMATIIRAASMLEGRSGGEPTLTRTPFQPLPYTSPTATRTAVPTSTPTSTFTASPTPTFTPTPIPPTETQTPVPSDTPIPLPTEPPPPDDGGFPPTEASVYGVQGHAQISTLDCEARSAVDLAAYFGVGIDEWDFLNRLPGSDDPNEGFVGSYNGAQGRLPPASYGVHAAPVAALLREYGLNAYDQYGISWDEVRAEIASGRPVITWVIGNVWPSGYPVSYTPSNGNTTIVAAWEHTVIVTGYTSSTVTVVDGGMTYTRSLDTFLSSWGVLGNMSITVSP